MLPQKGDKLMFGLCRTCIDRRLPECSHTQSERALHGTWTTDEVKKAVSKGYVIQKIFEVWHYDETEQYDPSTKRGGLFTEYINTFMKLKQESSGWPKDADTDTQKFEFIDSYYEKEGIMLDYENIEKNPGLRSLAQLMLNSFWGSSVNGQT